MRFSIFILLLFILYLNKKISNHCMSGVLPPGKNLEPKNCFTRTRDAYDELMFGEEFKYRNKCCLVTLLLYEPLNLITFFCVPLATHKLNDKDRNTWLYDFRKINFTYIIHCNDSLNDSELQTDIESQLSSNSKTDIENNILTIPISVKISALKRNSESQQTSNYKNESSILGILDKHIGFSTVTPTDYKLSEEISNILLSNNNSEIEKSIEHTEFKLSNKTNNIDLNNLNSVIKLYNEKSIIQKSYDYSYIILKNNNSNVNLNTILNNLNSEINIKTIKSDISKVNILKSQLYINSNLISYINNIRDNLIKKKKNLNKNETYDIIFYRDIITTLLQDKNLQSIIIYKDIKFINEKKNKNNINKKLEKNLKTICINLNLKLIILIILIIIILIYICLIIYL